VKGFTHSGHPSRKKLAGLLLYYYVVFINSGICCNMLLVLTM